jgi:hypothetical protein
MLSCQVAATLLLKVHRKATDAIEGVMLYNLKCPECGKTGERSAMRAAPPRVELVTGLDIEECPGCWDTMYQFGAAPGTYTFGENGVFESFTPVTRPEPKPRDHQPA